MSAPALGFRPVTAEDDGLLRTWLATPSWRRWWGDPEEEFELIRAMVEGRDPTSRPFLILLAGEPIGYIQAWEIGAYQTPDWAEEHPWLLDVPADALGVDLALGQEGHLGRGLGSAALRAFCESLRAQGAGPLIIDPDPENGRAVAAYRKAGFRPIPHLLGRTPGVLLMAWQPEAEAG